jgi:hypothetical protein
VVTNFDGAISAAVLTADPQSQNKTAATTRIDEDALHAGLELEDFIL